MKIILVATDNRGKNLVFVSDALRAYSLSEAVRLAREGALDNVYPVQRSIGVYLRTKPSVPKKEHLDAMAISSHRLFSVADNLSHALSTPIFGNYWPLYRHTLKSGEGSFIIIDDYALITQERARKKLQPHRDLIFAAAKKFDVYPYLLGAIIIDEIARFAPFEIITDPLGGHFLGANTSVGIAQVKIETARDLIKRDYYNPNPDDQRLSVRITSVVYSFPTTLALSYKKSVNNAPISYRLSPKNILKTSRQELYPYLKKPEHSISFAAARMRALTDEWKKFVDISKRPEIISTLYHLPRTYPHAHPQPNDRGLQIAHEFYKLAEKWLR